ncbi:MAG: hypothetical protein DRP87_08330 [Spirochaetes bacterium]|nr:MAG: hypothetical protein DRP87_08330 [Spirochaetota bacterium]
MSLIELKNISFSYPDGTRALSSVDLTIEGGEKTALLGENGSGKSTLLLLLNGTLRPESGDYLFKGKKITYTG